MMYFLIRAVRNYREELGLHLRVVFGFGMMVLVFSGYLLVLRNINALVERWGSELQVVAFLKPGIEAKDISAVIEAMQHDPAVATAEYVSPELAIKRFKADLGPMAGALDGLTTNPLPASVEIGVKSEYRDGPNIKELAGRAGKFAAVEEVQYGEGWIDRYDALLSFIQLAGALLGTFLLIITLGAVSNTIQLVIFARRDEIEILRLVGATDAFIKAPYMIEGMISGLLASVFGLGTLGGIFAVFAPRFETAFQNWFGSFAPVFLGPGTVILLALACMLTGLFSSLIAAHRHIRT